MKNHSRFFVETTAPKPNTALLPYPPPGVALRAFLFRGH